MTQLRIKKILYNLHTAKIVPPPQTPPPSHQWLLGVTQLYMITEHDPLISPYTTVMWFMWLTRQLIPVTYCVGLNCSVCVYMCV